MTRRASGICPARGVAMNAHASASAELVLAKEALRRGARGASLLNRQAAVAIASERAEETRRDLEAIEMSPPPLPLPPLPFLPSASAPS